VTAELARPAASVTGMDALLTRRLDRLRSTADRATRLIDVGLPARHADALARALGGRLASASEPVVVLETELQLPVDLAHLAALPYPVQPDRPLVCLDVETTGLGTAAGTLAFLVGLGIWRGDSFSVRQLLLADHSQEGALLDVLAAALPAGAWLVTYNGLTFDWPLIVSRYRLHRRPTPAPAGQLDLLPVARQLWRHRLPDARLATVERSIAGVMRHSDLPGALVPKRYFAYLRGRDAWLLRDVVEHNRQDIVSLALLLGILARDLADRGAWPRSHPGDLFGLARAHAQRARFDDALACLEAALEVDAWHAGVERGAQLRRRLSADRARLLGRLGRRREANDAWLEIGRRGGPGAALAWLRVASYREHVDHDLEGALAACREAGAAIQIADLWGHRPIALERDLAHRRTRLRRKQFAPPSTVNHRAA
jgi:uncharacterized protein YprB with RNaseH-like and TPR domain